MGWGPTITEINHLANDYDLIYHLAFLYEGKPKMSSIPYLAENIEFIALPISGGTSILDKLFILQSIPQTLNRINRVLKKVDAFQFRTPIGFGVYLIPYLTFFSSKEGWYKYAGNWNQKNASIGYRLQRYFLKKQNRKVTINGRWPDQPENCLTFENPCLTKEERLLGEQILNVKRYEAPFRFCFVGRLEDEKGVQRIIDAINSLKSKGLIQQIDMIGDGLKRQDYQNQITKNRLPIKLHGFLPRDKVFEIYKEAHFLLLPSTASEGFPKVIAEAMNYGCIPIVSSVSSIGQYVNASNGYIIKPTTVEKLHNILESVENTQGKELKSKADNGYLVSKDFTFEHYRFRIKNEILNF